MSGMNHGLAANLAKQKVTNTAPENVNGKKHSKVVSKTVTAKAVKQKFFLK